jgi:tricorn protease
MILSLAISTVAVLQISVDAKLMKFPDVTEGKIAFSYGGDIWVVSDQGGVARKLTNSPGIEGRPKFSPDGKWIAFTGQYDGNSDVYIVPSEGGEPRRLTYHPQTDIVLDWSPDGNTIYFASPRASMKGQVLEAYRVSVRGGTPEKLSLGECGALSPSPSGQSFFYRKRYLEAISWRASELDFVL